MTRDPGERILKLGFEAIESIPEGINEVRVYVDPILNCLRVGKRIDISMADPDSVPEASTLQSISHPNIVPIVTAAEVSGFTAPMRVIELVTPYFERGSITDALMRGEYFTGPEALAVMRASLLGLRELHTVHGICHRDIKSGNILLEKAPIHALLADLGIAGRLRPDGSVASANNPTIYSPPELLVSGRVSVTSDLYSMGLVLRELLGGRFPYETYTREMVEERLMLGRIPLKTEDLELPVWTPSRIVRIYRKCLQIHPRNRFQSAKELSDALNKCSIASWSQVDLMVWEASRDRDHAPTVRVEGQRIAGGIELSLKKKSGRQWRRPQGYRDVRTASLNTGNAKSVFDSANALT